MKVKYVGPFDAVEVPALDAVIKNGETVEVDDDMGLAMIEQEVWASVGTRMKTDNKKNEGDDK